MRLAGSMPDPSRVKLIEGSSLRSMFLPKLSSEGRRMLAANGDRQWVGAQLKHYGVQFDESEFSGNGTI